MKREHILGEAANLICKDRDAEYGTWSENSQVVANLWSEIVQCRKYKMPPLTRAQVALMLDALKTARLIPNPTHKDSWVDKCGYSALGGEDSCGMNSGK